MFKKFFQEFKEFAIRGNVMSLAVGVIIGSSFQGVVVSLTENLLSPIIGLFARQNFDSLRLDVLGISLRYGAFITSVLNFVIMAFVVFLIIRTMNKLISFSSRKKKPPPARLCQYCKTTLHKDATRCPACTSKVKLPENTHSS